MAEKYSTRLLSITLLGIASCTGQLKSTTDFGHWGGASEPDTRSGNPGNSDENKQALRPQMNIVTKETTTVASLSVSPHSGPAPLVVSLDIPAVIAEKMNSCIYSQGFFGASGNGLTVEWGDGTNSPTYSDLKRGQSCSNEVRTHTYTKAGTYTIKLRSWHPGPTDESITDWVGTAAVNVR